MGVDPAFRDELYEDIKGKPVKGGDYCENRKKRFLINADMNLPIFKSMTQKESFGLRGTVKVKDGINLFRF